MQILIHRSGTVLIFCISNKFLTDIDAASLEQHSEQQAPQEKMLGNHHKFHILLSRSFLI